MDDKPKTEPLTEREEAWVAEQARRARSFVAEQLPDAAGAPLTPEVLDRAYAAWMAKTPLDVTLVNGVVNAVGVAFGAFLAEACGFSWVIATDQYGTELALLALPGTADVLVFPANLVAKRWERRETGFLVPLFDNISRQVADSARAWRGRTTH